MDGKRDYARFKDPKQRELLHRQAQKWNVNHHFLERDDFEEFLEAWDEVMHLCPEFPTFRDYIPANGVLSAELTAYLSALMTYARSRGKRPVLCEINSRGRAGALRGEFGGYHIAQYRDPLSQFGSFLRALVDGGTWGFLSHPITELGVNGGHPLYRLIPEEWRAPNLPWRADSRARRWASDARYIAAAGSPRPDNVEKLFGWHLFAWVLNNLAAISYSDLVLDVDKAHDDGEYRASITDNLARGMGATVDFSDLKKYDRYYEFETFDIKAVCQQIVSTITEALGNGRLEDALTALGREAPINPTRVGVELLLAKLHDSLSSMAVSSERCYMPAEEWREIAERNRRIWFKPSVRWLAQQIYPLAHPVVQAARRAGISL
ncbi:MAG: hypothetical protein WAV38_00675 [Xanthobacteraceae bacterium]